MVDGRAKGSRGEREIAGYLAKWWGSIEPGCRFKRTPLSGGWGDAETRGGFKVAGDICTTAKFWPFTVEVKWRQKWSFGQFALGRRSPVWAWWRQAVDAAAEEDRIPIMFFKRNRMEWLVAMPEQNLAKVLARYGVGPLVTFYRISPTVDYADIRPQVVKWSVLSQLPPTAWLSRRQRVELASLGR